MLLNQQTPFEGFGAVLDMTDELVNRFRGVVEQATLRIEDVFKVSLEEPSQIPERLESIITNMWEQGWQPNDQNINLFATDFGCVLAKAIHELYGGTIIFRSTDDLSHLSIWWKVKQVELFPFHKTYKRLLWQEPDSIDYFIKSVAQLVR